MSTFNIIKRADIQLRAIKVAVVVGTILCLINHGDLLIAGDMSPSHWLKLALTYCVPYLVSLYSAVQALQQNTH